MSDDPFDHRIAVDAARTRRLITHSRLVELGLSHGAVVRRTDRGQLIRVVHGVYMVGVELLDDPMLRLAGLLYAGDRSALWLSTAADEHALLHERPGIARIIRPGNGEPLMLETAARMHDGGSGLIFIRPGGVRDTEIEAVDGARTTTVARTLVDIAAYRPHLFERAWKQAEFRRVLDVGEIEAQLARSRRKGNALVRAKLAGHVEVDAGLHGYDSLSELDAVKLVVAAGAPPPLVNHWVTAAGRRRRLDLYFEHAMLAIEVDDWAGHSTRTAFEDDPVRDSDLRTIGIQTSRFTTRKLLVEPGWCAERILTDIDRRVRELTALASFRRAA